MFDIDGIFCVCIFHRIITQLFLFVVVVIGNAIYKVPQFLMLCACVQEICVKTVSIMESVLILNSFVDPYLYFYIHLFY